MSRPGGLDRRVIFVVDVTARLFHLPFTAFDGVYTPSGGGVGV